MSHSQDHHRVFADVRGGEGNRGEAKLVDLGLPVGSFGQSGVIELEWESCRIHQSKRSNSQRQPPLSPCEACPSEGWESFVAACCRRGGMADWKHASALQASSVALRGHTVFLHFVLSSFWLQRACWW
mmetsp:Transcript_147317/g.473315  ORF Transcript_147317/g.473315 Transcript_147317/m.473315 type:complete len:128 (-) Transcript_147317:151-534(-)